MNRIQHSLFWFALIGPILLLTFFFATDAPRPVYANADVPRSVPRTVAETEADTAPDTAPEQVAQAQSTVTTTAQTGDTAPASESESESKSEIVTYTLPFDWQGAATISASDLAATAPPLAAIQVEGDFQVSYVPTETGSVIRLLAPGEPAAGQTRQIFVVWRLDGESVDLALLRNGVVTASVTARLYSPPEGADLLIRERAADDWSATRVTMTDIVHQTYTVSRTIGGAESTAEITEVQVGIEWQPSAANAWIELSDFQVSLPRAVAPAEPVAQADAPTETIEATTEATSAPEPTATKAPTETPTPVPTDTPIPLPTPTPAEPPTLTPFVVTSTPTAEDIFVEATRVTMATEWARVIGTATATPENMVTPTNTPTPIVVTNTPTPGNQETATHVALLATAIAATTGTPTPIPENAVVLVATETPLPTPRPAAAGRPTNTPTPYYVLLEDLPPTPEPQATLPVPDALMGKILFLSDYLSGDVRRPNAFVVNPDGTGVGVLTQRLFYNRAVERDVYSADRRFFVYSLREAGGAAHNAGRFQVFYDDILYSSWKHQATYFGVGNAWAAVWSPTDEVIALVSNESANDEIWVVRRNEWPPRQLTKNDWEWDHHPSFSPDGSKIVFHSNRVSGMRQLWVMDSDGSNQLQLTNLPAEAWNPVWVKYRD